MIDFNTKISELNRVGKTIAGRLAKLGIKNARDLLWHLPYRYEDWSKIKYISNLQNGEQATVQGNIELLTMRNARARKMKITECLLSDETGTIKIIWFNQPYIAKQLHNGDEISVSGKVIDKYSAKQFVNPQWEKKSKQTIHTGRIIPIYPLTAGITQKQIRFLIKQILSLAKKQQDFLPLDIIKKYDLQSLPDSLFKIHWPKTKQDYFRALKRLKFDELFFLQLIQLQNRKKLNTQSAPQINFKESAIKDMVKSLPFVLTDDQKRAAWQILQDIAYNKPMNRLLQGDVGSGKTVVAAIACLNVALSGYQAVVMAPTEILAKQHWHTFNAVLSNFSVSTALFTRSYKKTNITEKVNKRSLLNLLKQGKIKIIIGTHALLQSGIDFFDLGLVIIDEQHRFGVEQRAKLVNGEKKYMPHFLSMTATPIPRSLALALYGDLDISLIKQKPRGRKKIITKLVMEKDRDKAYDFIKTQIRSGQQVFVICPLIDESDKLGVKSATQVFTHLQNSLFKEFNIGLLHGKLKVDIKQKTMDNFKNGKIDILVSTSVVEVGVDVPNATIMMIEGAERFGLAQLHQFRGRVGRSNKQSYCFLFASEGAESERLRLMTKTNDGLKLAEYDLRWRGSGDVYGTRQSGFNNLKIASFDDLQLIKLAKKVASEVVDDLPKYPLLNKELSKKQNIFHLE